MAVTVKLAAPALRGATSYYAWPLPTVRGDKDIWGDILNTQTFAGIDAAMHNNNPATTGSIDNMVIGGVNPKAATFASMVLNTPLPVTSGGTGATTAATARSNLGVSASGADTAYAWRTNNLSDLTNVTTARTNLGLGTAALKNTGTSGNAVPLLDGANTFAAQTVFNGNVGIGTTPTHLMDVRKDQNATTMLEVANADSGTAARTALQVANATYSSGIYTYGVNYAGSGIFSANTALFYSNAPTQVVLATGGAPLVFATNNTERMRIDANGKVIVQNLSDSPTALTINGTVTAVRIGTDPSTGSAIEGVNPAASVYKPLRIGGEYLVFAAGLSAANTERARITADGYQKICGSGGYRDLVGPYHEINTSNGNAPTQIMRSSATDPYGHLVEFSAVAPNNGANYFIRCTDSSLQRINLLSNGGIANYSANNVNLSDAHLKTDITPYVDADLDALEHSFRAVDWGTFKYKDQSHQDRNHGYTAQGVERAFADSAPELVDDTELGPKGGRHKAVYDADLTHIGMALLARALKRIDELEHLVHDKKRHKR